MLLRSRGDFHIACAPVPAGVIVGTNGLPVLLKGIIWSGFENGTMVNGLQVAPFFPITSCYPSAEAHSCFKLFTESSLQTGCQLTWAAYAGEQQRQR